MVFVTTADTDILTADRALAGLPQGGPRVRAFHPAALESDDSRRELLESVAQAGAVVLRLLGGKRAMPDVFDQLVSACKEQWYPAGCLPGPPGMGRGPGYRLLGAGGRVGDCLLLPDAGGN